MLRRYVISSQLLFSLFAQLFCALTGRDVRLITRESEIQERMLWRAKHETSEMAQRVNAAAEQLEAFYAANAPVSLGYAKTLGGMRLVMGGQRTFGPSALNAVRITGLYADTQLIPDPILNRPGFYRQFVASEKYCRSWFIGDRFAAWPCQPDLVFDPVMPPISLPSSR